MFGGGLGEFEEHGQRGLPGAVAFGATVTQADGREGGFNRVRGSHMLPVFGGEVVEGQEHVAVSSSLSVHFAVCDAIKVFNNVRPTLRT